GVNPLPPPSDAMITEITNESIVLAGGEPITIVANFFFSAASTIVLALVAALVTTRIVEPRLGPFDTSRWTGAVGDGDTPADDPEAKADESRGLRFAGLAGL